MSNPSPYIVTVSEDGLYFKVEMDAHYVTDEQAETIRKYIKTLESENVRLQDENARLCSCLSDDAENARIIMAENAKLRELLDAVLQCAGETKRDKGCDACPMYDGPWRNDGTWCLLRPTLRELGIEVEQ